MAVLAADTIGTELIVAMLADALVLHTAQHFHHMGNTEALVHPVYAGQCLLRHLKGVKVLGWVKADIAVATRFFPRLAKVIEQHLTTASLGLGKRPHGVELVAFHQFLRALFLFIQATAQPSKIRWVIEQDSLCRQAITASPSSFLIIGFDIARNVIVDHKAHVGLVDPHAESHGRHHDLDIITLERFLDPGPLIMLHPGMICRRTDSTLIELFADLLHPLAAVAVDNATLTTHTGQVAGQLGHRLVFFLQGIADIRPIEAAEISMLILKCQAEPQYLGAWSHLPWPSRQSPAPPGNPGANYQ